MVLRFPVCVDKFRIEIWVRHTEGTLKIFLLIIRRIKILGHGHSDSRAHLIGQKL